MSVGDRIMLDFSNATTGFEWEHEITGSSMLMVSHKFLPPVDDVTGAAGEYVWMFEAAESGEAEVILEYSRPWEGKEKGE